MEKNLFIVAAITALLLAGAVAAASFPGFPLPINGKLIGTNVGAREITVQNSRTGISMSTQTSSAGEYLVDWANSDDKGGTIARSSVGDKFIVTVVECASEPVCKQTLDYVGQDEVYTTFDLTSITFTDPAPSPEPETCPEPTICPEDTTPYDAE